MHGRALSSVHIWEPFVECLHWAVGRRRVDCGSRHHSLCGSGRLIWFRNLLETLEVKIGLAFRTQFLHRRRLGEVLALLAVVRVDIDWTLVSIGNDGPVLWLIARQSKEQIERPVSVSSEIVRALLPVSTSTSIAGHPKATFCSWEETM